MHDTLQYLGRETVHRQHHHGEITFSILYTWSENFILPLSHDEVVHGKGSLVNKFPGDRWQKMATLRALYGYMWAHPGKQLIFMGDEFAQNDEWSESRSLDWHLTEYGEHAQIQKSVATLNRIYRSRSELWQRDVSGAGFQWLIGDDASGNTLAFARINDAGERMIVATNFSAVPHLHYRIPLPASNQESYPGRWCEIFNSDLNEFGGSGLKNNETIKVVRDSNSNENVLEVVLPPLSTIWLTPRK